jgi:dienelactone hydrolase
MTDSLHACAPRLLQGATTIGVMGFCYGGHPCCWASAENEDVVAGVVLHPSMQLEQFAFGGDCAALLQSVKCPFFLGPAGNDLPTWGDGGDFVNALKASAKGADFVYSLYPEMTHGWSVRGDVEDAAVKRDVEKVMGEAKAFFAKHMA